MMPSLSCGREQTECLLWAGYPITSFRCKRPAQFLQARVMPQLLLAINQTKSEHQQIPELLQSKLCGVTKLGTSNAYTWQKSKSSTLPQKQTPSCDSQQKSTNSVPPHKQSTSDDKPSWQRPMANKQSTSCERPTWQKSTDPVPPRQQTNLAEIRRSLSAQKASNIRGTHIAEIKRS